MIKFKKIVTCDVPNCNATEEIDYNTKNRNALPIGWMTFRENVYCADCLKKLGIYAKDAESAGMYADAPTTP